MSPKEYSYNKKTFSIRTPGENLTYSSKKSRGKNVVKEDKKGVSKYLRDAIFRKRIFELYDNLRDIRPIEDIVEEGSYRACKDIVVNRVLEIEGSGASVDPEKISKLARKSFPYRNIPRERGKARNFFTAALCNLVSSLVLNASDGKKGS
jgi:hypothetical protein